MFFISLTYKKPLAEIEKWMTEHKIFLEKYYASGQFLLSGRKMPRTGGVILAIAQTKTEIENIIQSDPFYREKIADYDIIEFLPTMAAPDFSSILKI